MIAPRTAIPSAEPNAIQRTSPSIRHEAIAPTVPKKKNTSPAIRP